jgi:hypothetical protein
MPCLDTSHKNGSFDTSKNGARPQSRHNHVRRVVDPSLYDTRNQKTRHVFGLGWSYYCFDLKEPYEMNVMGLGFWFFANTLVFHVFDTCTGSTCQAAASSSGNVAGIKDSQSYPAVRSCRWDDSCGYSSESVF